MFRLATCALTENGFLRFSGHPYYPTSPKGTRLEVRFPLPFRVLAMLCNPR